MRAEIDALSPEQRRILIRLVGLFYVPQDNWSQDDLHFFREVRAVLQGSVSNGTEQRSGSQGDTPAGG